MSNLRTLARVVRLIPSEVELWIHDKVLQIHHGEFISDEHGSICVRHLNAQTWPCDDFLRADRAIDAVLERRASI